MLRNFADMIKHILYTVVCWSLLINVAYSQGFLKKLENKIETKTNTILNGKGNSDSTGVNGTDDKSILGGIRNKMESERREYDQSNFNYAISFSDNAGFYKTNRKGQQKKSMLMNMLKEERTDYEKASAANLAGEMLYADGSSALAEQQFEKSIALYTEIDSTNGLSYALPVSNLALVLQNTGRYTRAMELNQKALDIRSTKAKGTAVHAASLNNMAVLYKELGEYEESEKLINQAIAINEEKLEKTQIPLAITLNNKAMLYQTLGRYDEAEKLMNRCLEVADEEMREKSPNYTRFKINLAILYKETGRLELAKKEYEEQIKIKKRRFADHQPEFAHLCKGLAAVLLEMDGDHDEEIVKLLKDALEIYEKEYSVDHPAYATTAMDLGNFYRIKGETDQASEYLTKAVEIRKQLLGANHLDYYQALESLSLLRWQEGNIDEATEMLKEVSSGTLGYIDTYFAHMSETEKAKFWDKLQPRLQKFYSFTTANYQKRPELLGIMFNNQLKTKALLLNASSKVRETILKSGNKELINTYLAWLKQKEELARVYTLTKEELAEEQINVDSLERATNQMEKELNKASEEFSSEYNKGDITYDLIQAQLGPNEALVEIIRYRVFSTTFKDSVHYAALILTADKDQPDLVLLEDGNKMEGLFVKAYRKAIVGGHDAPEAYARYWSPIGKQIADKKRLYVSVDGVYNLISLNTLKNGAEYMIDDHDIFILSNSKDLLKIKSPDKQTVTKTATLVGFPDYGDNDAISSLPGTKKEIEYINTLLQKYHYKTNEYLAKEATEEHVKNTHSYIVHVATHGFFFPDIDHVKADRVFGIETSTAKSNPLHRSGLLLANAEATIFGQEADHSTSNNGILTAYETMNLSLDHTDLVVLSACETGLGDIKAGEGVYGLQRSFLVAGANSVIMSLWQVSDDATMELMSNFYEIYLKTGNKQLAFHQAQLKVKEKFPAPFFWGAFVLVGT